MNQKKDRKAHGFTLIELLIVVAIIAILAAIAVPNFLEAQVRAKISRAKADMRTYATAIEAYAVDNNNPPPGYNSILNKWISAPPPTPNSLAYYSALAPLTTPIAFMTSLPADPFRTASVKNQQTGALAGFDKSQPFVYNDMHCVIGKTTGNLVWLDCQKAGFTWSLHTFGPSYYSGSCENILMGKWAQPGFGTIYDPTNGTVSRGFILRTNKGFFPNG